MNSMKYRPTYILIALNIAVYAYTSIVGGDWVSTNFNAIPPWYQFNFDVFHGALLPAFHFYVCSCFNSSHRREHVVSIYFRFKGGGNVLFARIPGNLLDWRIGG